MTKQERIEKLKKQIKTLEQQILRIEQSPSKTTFKKKRESWETVPYSEGESWHVGDFGFGDEDGKTSGYNGYGRW